MAGQVNPSQAKPSQAKQSQPAQPKPSWSKPGEASPGFDDEEQQQEQQRTDRNNISRLGPLQAPTDLCWKSSAIPGEFVRGVTGRIPTYGPVFNKTTGRHDPYIKKPLPVIYKYFLCIYIYMYNYLYLYYIFI